ncbi:hypothetical protein J6590_081890 [Homalodisca vitripennis]|nr:hypothetical protein J6590_081890 [Homalodisca vitripennis]
MTSSFNSLENHLGNTEGPTRFQGEWDLMQSPSCLQKLEKSRRRSNGEVRVNPVEARQIEITGNQNRIEVVASGDSFSERLSKKRVDPCWRPWRYVNSTDQNLQQGFKSDKYTQSPNRQIRLHDLRRMKSPVNSYQNVTTILFTAGKG